MNTTLTIVSVAACTALATSALTYILLQSKIKAIAESQKHQLLNLRHELITKTNEIDLAAYLHNKASETVIYDSKSSNALTDFYGHGGRVWDYAAHEFANGDGSGSYEIKNGIITIYRTNEQGRYELQLKHYGYKHSPDKIPADNSIQMRELRLSMEVKRGDSSQLLRFVFKGEITHNALDEKQYVVFNPDWEKINLVFRIPANEPSYLRIDDLLVTKAPSQIQLRNIVLYEKRADANPQL